MFILCVYDIFYVQGDSIANLDKNLQNALNSNGGKGEGDNKQKLMNNIDSKFDHLRNDKQDRSSNFTIGTQKLNYMSEFNSR